MIACTRLPVPRGSPVKTHRERGNKARGWISIVPENGRVVNLSPPSFPRNNRLPGLLVPNMPQRGGPDIRLVSRLLPRLPLSSLKASRFIPAAHLTLRIGPKARHFQSDDMLDADSGHKVRNKSFCRRSPCNLHLQSIAIAVPVCMNLPQAAQCTHQGISLPVRRSASVDGRVRRGRGGSWRSGWECHVALSLDPAIA